MPFDRAGYLNNQYGYGHDDRSSCAASRKRCNDTTLVKKELHYIETYVKTHDSAKDKYCNDSAHGNYGYGCNSNGYNNGGYGCEPCYDNGSCNDYCPPPCNNYPVYDNCGPCNDQPYYDEHRPYKNDYYHEKKHDKSPKIHRKDKHDDACNPFCKPCHKPVCNDPVVKTCQCNACKKSFDKIYRH